MGCSPSHALIINSTRTNEPICLQPRIYMVSESTLRILQDVGELRLYQQEDKDPGVARVKFGTNTLDQLENPLGYQSQVRRQFSMDSEQGVTVSRKDSKITVNMEQNQDALTKRDTLADEEQENEGRSGFRRGDTCQSLNSSSSTLIVAQIHNPLSLKTLAKESVSSDANPTRSAKTPDSETNLFKSNNSSSTSLQC